MPALKATEAGRVIEKNMTANLKKGINEAGKTTAKIAIGGMTGGVIIGNNTDGNNESVESNVTSNGSAMKVVYNSLGAIIGFTVVVLIIQNFVGEKASQYTVLFTLLGMLILNANKLLSFAKSFKL